MSHPAKEGAWVHWEDRAVFSLSGPDRVRYLNGQVSNNVSQDLSNKTIAACLCSLKGKVDALVFITEREDKLFIDGELRQREFLAERLDRYLIADDCELEDITGEWTLFHRLHQTQESRSSQRLGIQGEDLWLPRGDNPGWPENLEMTRSEFELLKIRSLYPESDKVITGNEFPSELGLDRWAVDFHKGCYLGQEIVSRIESVGRTKRELVCFSADEALSEGQKVFQDSFEIEIRQGIRDEQAERFYGLGLRTDSKRPPENDEVAKTIRIRAEAPLMRSATNH